MFFAITSYINGIASIFVAIFVYSRRRDAHLGNLFCGLTLSIAWYSILLANVVLSQNEYQAIFWAKIEHISVALIPAISLHFCLAVIQLDKRAKPQLLLAYLFSTFLIFTLPTGWFENGVREIAGLKFYIRPGPLYFAYALFYIICFAYAEIALLKTFFSQRGSRLGHQALFVFWASFLGSGAGAVTFLPVFGFNVTPSLNCLVIFYVISLAYAILKHGLLDIEVIIRRTAVFAGLFAFVYGTFTVFTILGQEIFSRALDWNQWVAMIPTVLVVTFALRPLEIYLTNATEKFLFQKQYDYRQLLKVFTDQVLTIIELQKLTEKTIAGLNTIIKPESAAILLHDKDVNLYKLVASAGIKEKEITIKADGILISYLKKTNHPILRDKSVDEMENGELKESFRQLNAQLCLPIELHDNLIGVLSLGRKKSGDDYTQEDIDILSTLAKTEAIAISNAQLFQELSATQAEAAQREKMAVIGTLAAGINHEICNPLGIVRGQCEMFLLNLRDGFYQKKTVEEMTRISEDIMAKVIKETDRATAITKKLSGFAKPSKKGDLERVSIGREVDEVLGLLGHDLKLNNIDIQKEFPTDYPVIMADKKQIEEVLFNLIRNSAQAMDKKEGKIIVQGLCQNGSATVKISDNGSGIPPDKLGQIFHPFYTTKAPGKGTGLGLFIVKQVVERNQGTIAVESEQGAGTTFTLKFPAAHA